MNLLLNWNPGSGPVDPSTSPTRRGPCGPLVRSSVETCATKGRLFLSGGRKGSGQTRTFVEFSTAGHPDPQVERRPIGRLPLAKEKIEQDSDQTGLNSDPHVRGVEDEAAQHFGNQHQTEGGVCQRAQGPLILVSEKCVLVQEKPEYAGPDENQGEAQDQ